MKPEKIEPYFLISESAINAINSKVEVLNRAAQFMKNEGFVQFSESIIVYGIEVGAIINQSVKCDVVPISVLLEGA